MTLTLTLKEDGCIACPIRHRAICARCDADELSQLEAMKHYTSYKAGDPIIWRGDPMSQVASVVTGVATLGQTLEDGRRQTLGLLLPSDFIGRPGRTHAIYDITAVTDVTLCCFQRPAFEVMLEETPHIAGRMLEMTLDELEAAREWMLLLGRKTAREKIASFLMLISRRTTSPEHGVDGRKITLPLTREAMADYLGLTIETVSRQFSKLRKDGLILLEGNRDVFVPDLQALRVQSGEDADLI